MILERVHKSLQLSGIVRATRLIVAVSGGCDSVALLHLLKRLSDALALDLHVASLDHGLRGAAGRGDRAFVGELAKAWGLPRTLGQVDVPRLAQEWGMGIEAAARRARYDFLAQVAQQEDSKFVVLGHHSDDQTETILMNIVRGSGLRGLRGMRLVAPMPNQPDLMLIRPLLSVTRAELEQYCNANSLHCRQDESNWDTRYGRNFMRHEVMDKLSRLNPAVTRALNRLADSAAIDEQFITGQVDALAEASVLSWGDGYSISRPLFLEAHPALQRRLLRLVFQQIASADESLTHELTLDLLAFCQTARSGSGRDIGAALELRVDYDQIHIQRKGSRGPPRGFRLIPGDTDIALQPAKGLEIGGLSIRVCAQPGECLAGVLLALPSGCELRLRTRRAGDRFKPKGMGGRSRKLKDWMIDRKIPRRIRDQIPLLCADDAIVAICLERAWRVAELGAPPGGASSGILVCLE